MAGLLLSSSDTEEDIEQTQRGAVTTNDNEASRRRNADDDDDCAAHDPLEDELKQELLLLEPVDPVIVIARIEELTEVRGSNGTLPIISRLPDCTRRARSNRIMRPSSPPSWRQVFLGDLLKAATEDTTSAATRSGGKEKSLQCAQDEAAAAEASIPARRLLALTLSTRGQVKVRAPRTRRKPILSEEGARAAEDDDEPEGSQQRKAPTGNVTLKNGALRVLSTPHEIELFQRPAGAAAAAGGAARGGGAAVKAGGAAAKAKGAAGTTATNTSSVDAPRYVRAFRVLAECHENLLSSRVCTTREIYYRLADGLTVTSQRQVDNAVQDIISLLQARASSSLSSASAHPPPITVRICLGGRPPCRSARCRGPRWASSAPAAVWWQVACRSRPIMCGRTAPSGADSPSRATWPGYAPSNYAPRRASASPASSSSRRRGLVTLRLTPASLRACLRTRRRPRPPSHPLVSVPPPPSAERRAPAGGGVRPAL